MRRHLTYTKIAQWEIYDRIAGSDPYSDAEKKFLPHERYDWTLLTEIELLRNAVRGCKKVLDIGCGTGHPSLYLAGDVGSIIGIDKSEKMIAIARSKLSRRGVRNVTFQVGDAEDLEFSASSFDAVVLCGSLATFSNKKKALQEIRRVLKKDGKVACIEANWLFQSGHGRHFRGEGSFTLSQDGLIKYRYVERSVHPHKEVDYRCVIDPESSLGKELLSNRGLLKQKTLITDMRIKEVEPHCTEIEYDEEEKFDPETIARLFTQNGFKASTVSGYGAIYDSLEAGGLVDKMARYMKSLAKAEASISRYLDATKTEMLFLTCRTKPN